jgi:cation transport regulator ChaC
MTIRTVVHAGYELLVDVQIERTPPRNDGDEVRLIVASVNGGGEPGGQVVGVIYYCIHKSPEIIRSVLTNTEIENVEFA